MLLYHSKRQRVVTNIVVVEVVALVASAADGVVKVQSLVSVLAARR